MDSARGEHLEACDRFLLARELGKPSPSVRLDGVDEGQVAPCRLPRRWSRVTSLHELRIFNFEL